MARALKRLRDMGNRVRSCVRTVMMDRGRVWNGNRGRVSTLGRIKVNVRSGIRVVQS